MLSVGDWQDGWAIQLPCKVIFLAAVETFKSKTGERLLLTDGGGEVIDGIEK